MNPGDVSNASPPSAHDTPHVAPRGRHLWLLSFAALGVVYGDIGTSPLYAIRECFHGAHAIAATHDNVLGVLSLIFWALVLVISGKYLVLVLRADNHGEGGILSLTALATSLDPRGASGRTWLPLLGIFGAALLYGDGIITPAISVLSALEGLSVAAPSLGRYVVPGAIAVLVALFAVQRHGTARIGRIFGPITMLWFGTLAGLGLIQVVQHPAVLMAINPAYGFEFFVQNGWHGYVVLGSVFLVVTGGESLYADMGHFGKLPIRLDWFLVVLPALLLNYFGQGALVLREQTAVENPFFLLAPEWGLYPLVLLATAAAVIASQAVISGAYSLTMQAVQLGFSPRVKIEHTSPTQFGQIYIPAVNWALMVGCIALVLSFRSSTHLAAAYGMAVTSTMIITTMMLYVVARRKWNWSIWTAGSIASFFLAIDLSFFGSNTLKLAQGGWFPLLLAGLVFLGMSTWRNGRRILQERVRAVGRPLDEFLAAAKERPVIRVPGAAVFMNSNAAQAPAALVQNLKHNKVLHEQIIFVTVKTRQIPTVAEEDRVQSEDLGNGFYRIAISYGYMEEPDIPSALASSSIARLLLEADVTYFLGRETIIASQLPGMAVWREKLFARMARNSTTATAYFCIPPDRVVELGEQIEI
ncbi:MAG: potassium transporter Kup [Vicinamibacterales bacterium]